MQFILASQSPQRQNLIKSLPYDWQIMPADLDEQAIRFASPQAKARNIAQAKASKISQQLTGDYLIVAADTFSLCRGKILEKPHSKAAAQRNAAVAIRAAFKVFDWLCLLVLSRWALITKKWPSNGQS